MSRAGDSWPQFRGLAAGHTEVKDLPLTWSETEHVKWKTPLPGEGWSSPVVANGQIWMTTALEEGASLHALCCDLATGEVRIDVEVFRNAVIPPKHERNSYASPTPILDGDRVYVNFGSMGTACLSTKDGHKLWENREFQVDHQNGPGGSPALFQDKLLLAFDGRDLQYEIALNKMTGQLAWKTERSAIPKLQAKPADMRKSYPTPVIFQIDGQAQTLSTGAERLYSYDPNTGHELWSVDYPGFSNVPLPVLDNGMLFVCTGFNKPEIWGIRVGGAHGDATASHVVWRQHTAVPDQSTPRRDRCAALHGEQRRHRLLPQHGDRRDALEGADQQRFCGVTPGRGGAHLLLRCAGQDDRHRAGRQFSGIGGELAGRWLHGFARGRRQGTDPANQDEPVSDRELRRRGK
ncbi:MAG: PQQ-binding-like beta-propeller repeat protein [Chthoniobacter sp.]